MFECQVRLIDLQKFSGCFQNSAVFGSTHARHIHVCVCVYELFSPMKWNRNSRQLTDTHLSPIMKAASTQNF